MKIENHPPYVRRGVTQLMYVGDNDAVDAAVASGKPAGPDLVRLAKIAGVVWVAMWVLSGISPSRPRLRSRRVSTRW